MKKLIFALLLLATAPVFAQQNGNPPPPSAPADPPPAQPAQRPQRTPEQRAQAASNHLVKTLGINDDQKQKVYDLTLMRINKMSEIRTQYSNDKPKMRAEMKALQPVFDGKMKEILTPDQYTQWLAQRSQGAGSNGAGKKPQN
jgi:hypothetical protein